MTVSRAFTDHDVQLVANVATLMKRDGARGVPCTVHFPAPTAVMFARALERGVLPEAYQARLIANMEASADRVDANVIETDRVVEELKAQRALLDAAREKAAALRDVEGQDRSAWQPVAIVGLIAFFAGIVVAGILVAGMVA